MAEDQVLPATSQDNNSSAAHNSAPSSNASVSSSSVSTEPKQSVQEKMLSQSEVNELAGKLKRESYEKGLKEAEARFNAQQQANVVQQSMSSNSNQTGFGGIDEEKIRIARIAAREEANLANGQRILNEFAQKMLAAKESNKYPDFEEKVVQLNLQSIPHIIGWANSLPNTADVMYEIANNPGKFAEVMMVSQTSPHLAVSMLQKLSNSIKENEEAAKQPKAAAPLSQVKPSNTSTDNGSMSVSDLRKQSWLTG